MTINTQKAHRMPITLDKKAKPSNNIIIKTQNLQNKETILKAEWEKDQVTSQWKRGNPTVSTVMLKERNLA